MSDERARTINTLREIAQALDSDAPDKAVEILGTVGPEAANGRPSATQLSVVALEALDSWYAANNLRNAMVRVPQRDTPRAIRNITPALAALASKGRALRSADSLLQRNPEPAVAGAGAYMVTATLRALAQQRDAEFAEVLNELLPEQEVAEPIEPAPVQPAAPAEQPGAAFIKTTPTPTPAVEDHPVDIVDEPAEPTEASADDPQSRYTAIVETRLLAGVKEFFQWMGDSHAVTGTGLPKRADIKDVAATIDIDAEGVAKKPEEPEPAASDVDLSVAAEPRPTRYATSAAAIPELMAFWTTLQQTQLVQVSSTKIQPGTAAHDFAFEDVEQLDAAEHLVATYVAQTLRYDADEAAARQTAQFILDAEAVQDTDALLIPRLRQLEAMELLQLTDGQPVIAAGLQPAVTKGAQQVAA